MTTDGALSPRQPDDNEPREELFSDDLDLIDETIARITDTEIDGHLQHVLDQAGYSTQSASPPEGGMPRPGLTHLTSEDVRSKRFSTTRLKPGYDEEEVDAFLDQVEAELGRLIRDNEVLQAKLAEMQRTDRTRPSPTLASPLTGAAPDLITDDVSPGGDRIDTAGRILSFAQQTADQAVTDARRDADETINRARHEADEVLASARHQAEQVTGDARTHAENVERDAQERHRRAMAALVQAREDLERRVADLRAFEREYRSRLKAHMEGELRDLDAGITDAGPSPASRRPQPMPPAGIGDQQPVQDYGAEPSRSAYI